MSTTSKKLSGYSISSLAFLAAATLPANEAQGQIAYTDLDPDVVLYDESDSLDLDFDGISDIRLSVNVCSSSYYGGSCFFVRANPMNLDLQMGVNSEDSPLAYNPGAIIGPSAGTSNFANWPFDPLVIESSSSGLAYEAGDWLGVSEGYIGYRIDQSTGWHYGWIRLEITSARELIIKSFAYNNTPDQEVIVGFHTAPPQAVNAIINGVTDLALNNPVQEMGVDLSFPPDESSISEYRVMMVPFDSYPSFDIATAAAAPASGYLVVPTGVGASFSADLSSTTTDALGGVYEYYKDYVIVVLSVADGTVATINTLSEPSNTFQQELIVGTMGSLLSSDVDDTNLGADVGYSFTAPTHESLVDEYRLMMSTESLPPGSRDSLLAVPPAFYKVVSTSDPKNGELAGLDNFIEGDQIELGRRIGLTLLAVGLEPQGSNYRQSFVTLRNPDWQVQNITSDIPTTASNFEEITVNFDAAIADTEIAEYRVMLQRKTWSVPDGWTLSQASSDQYVVATPDGSGGFTALTTGVTKDTYGFPFDSTVAYDIIILSHGAIRGNDFAEAGEDLFIPGFVYAVVNAVAVDDAGGDYIEATLNLAQLPVEYRAMVVPDAIASTFTVDDARAIIPSNYNTIWPTATPVTQFGLTDFEVTGTAIIEGVDYRVFVLNIMPSSYPEPAYLSDPSEIVRLGDAATGLEQIEAVNLEIGSENGLLSYAVDAKGTVGINVVDNLGRIVYSSGGLAPSGQLDLQYLPQGIYHLQVQTASGRLTGSFFR